MKRYLKLTPKYDNGEPTFILRFATASLSYESEYDAYWVQDGVGREWRFKENPHRQEVDQWIWLYKTTEWPSYVEHVINEDDLLIELL